MKTGAAFKRGLSRQDHPTPADFMLAVKARFGAPTFDLAADEKNTKAPEFYTIHDDSLAQNWSLLGPGPLWLNPPFDNIRPWAAKCEQEAKRGAWILFLTPASVGSNWFSEFVWDHSLVLFLNGRITFEGQTAPYPKDCILSCYGRGLYGAEVWPWQEEVMADPFF
jgi:phage N-6-adenine-methyltransferase